MIITLYGQDSYRRIKKLNDIVSAYLGKYSGLSYERFDLCTEENVLRFKDFASGQSIFDQVKLAILDNILECSKEKEIRDILKTHTKNKNITIIVNLNKKPPSTFGFLLKKPAIDQGFPVLKDKKLEEIIKNIALDHGVELNQDTTRYLKETFGGDTWSIATEIEQMAFTTNHNTKTRPRLNYFLLTNTLKNGRTVKERIIALELLLSERKDDPARIFNSVAYYLGSQTEAEKFADYDVNAKSGKLEYEEVLLKLALGI
jgi:DNA polymerase III delta subunit